MNEINRIESEPNGTEWNGTTLDETGHFQDGRRPGENGRRPRMRRRQQQQQHNKQQTPFNKNRKEATKECDARDESDTLNFHLERKQKRSGRRGHFARPLPAFSAAFRQTPASMATTLLIHRRMAPWRPWRRHHHIIISLVSRWLGLG